jgi:hypothetical protein
VVFALPLGVRLTGQRVRRIDVVAALVVAAALAAFLLVTDPTGGRDDAPFGEWMVACGGCAAAAAVLMLVSRGAPPARRAAVIGAAAGILFGLTAALTKSVGDQFADSVLSIFTHWHLYGLIAVGYVALTLSQLSLQTGVLAPAIAACMAADPIASVVLGTTLMQESLDTSVVSIAVAVVALVAASLGLSVLARTQGEGAATKPAGGTQVIRARPAPQGAA